MPTWDYNGSWLWYIAWNAAAFAVSFVPNSFLEWISHRFILHSKAIVRFAYEEHDRTHHVIYRDDESFSMPGFEYGVDFHLREWLLFLVFIIPAWAGVEFLVGKPILVGATLSTLLWLQMFNVLHRLYHAPTGSWIERTWYFNYLKEHHRGHHADSSENLNVAFLPIADIVLGTLKR